jgi:hypothetical protein
MTSAVPPAAFDGFTRFFREWLALNSQRYTEFAESEDRKPSWRPLTSPHSRSEPL